MQNGKFFLYFMVKKNEMSSFTTNKSLRNKLHVTLLSRYKWISSALDFECAEGIHLYLLIRVCSLWFLGLEGYICI